MTKSPPKATKATPKKTSAKRSPAKKTAAKKAKAAPTKAAASNKTPSQLIDGRIEELGDWRGAMLGTLRALIKEADPNIVEEWKWRGVPTWYDNGIVCTGETYKAVVKTTFAHGAALPDPSKLFNSSLAGGTRRAIDIHEGETIDETAFKTLVRDAAAFNKSKAKR